LISFPNAYVADPHKLNTKETLENQADLRDNDHVIVGAHWGDGQ